MKLRVKELREKKGWSQQEAAHHMDLSIGAIQSIECGRALPSFRTIVKMKKAFGCNYIDDLLDEVI